MLDIQGVGYRIGKKEILHSITFTGVPGSVMGIIGPNGAGKSTLLRLIAGDRAPSSGHISWKPQNIQEKSSASN